MTSSTHNSLTREKIQLLLAAVGGRSDKNTEQNIEAVEYDWRLSHYFDPDQLEKLNDFSQKLAQNLAKKFNRLYYSDFNVTIASTTQHFAGELIAPDKNKNDYFLSFANGEKTFGLIGIPVQTAITWATQLLGDSKSAQNADRDLSLLEYSLLFDIVTGVIEAFSDSYGDCELNPAGEIVKGSMPVGINETQEICKIGISVKRSDSEKASEAYFWVFCDKLQKIAGQKQQQGENIPTQNISKAMLNHVQSVPISVTVKLAEAKFNFHELMSLQVDDIILLDKKVNESAGVIIEGKPRFRGRLAKSDSKYAIVITEPYNTK